MDIDKFIESEDRDDEPRDICPECGEEVGDCNWLCSHSDDYYEAPVPDCEPDDAA